MAFKLVSKNNIGIFTTLVLVILLSQSNFFDFLMDTPLGRITLLAFVIFIAYTNEILGLIAVLCIVIAFNSNVNIVSGYNLYEGMESMNEDEDDEDADEDDKAQKPKKPKLSKAQRLLRRQKKEAQRKQNITNNFNRGLEEARKAAEQAKRQAKGTEGFCMTDRENNMLRGKQSNSISVFDNVREQSDDVSPSDKSIFTSDYETF